LTATVGQVGKYLGKTIEDAMGRPVGKLVGLTTDIKDEVTAIQIAHSDGEVAQHPMTFVKVLEDKVILMQTWRVEAEDLRKERDIIMRRRQAIDLLLKDGDIEKTEYDQLRSTYEELDRQIKEKRETLLETLQHVHSKLEQQISDLQGALTNNKMLYSSAEIDEQTYHTVTESIRSGLEISRKERKDIENITQYLNGIDSVEMLKETIPPQTKNPLSDVVVIKLNEQT
jgi:chromosome segregation ATPase